MEEDAYTIASNMGLEMAKEKIYELSKGRTGSNFADVRQCVQRILQLTSMTICNGIQDNNCYKARIVAGLLAKSGDFAPANKDSILVSCMMNVVGRGLLEEVRFHAAECEKKYSRNEARFSCWRGVISQTSPQALRNHKLLYSLSLGSRCLLQFDFPVTQGEASVVSGISTGELFPLRPSRWERLSQGMLASGKAIAQGTPAPDFVSDLFTYRYRLYLGPEEEWYLLPLFTSKKTAWICCSAPGCSGTACFSAPGEETEVFCSRHKKPGTIFIEAQPRRWCLLNMDFDTIHPLFEAEECIPPSRKGFCESGPDSRLKRALMDLSETPETLRLNPIVHEKKKLGGDKKAVPLLAHSGLPFCVGNTSAPLASDKKAASALNRMPVLGSSRGVRSSMTQPLGGVEISRHVLGSERDFIGVLVNQAIGSREGVQNQKEVTALGNKKATAKSSTASLSRSGKIYGSYCYDNLCRKKCGGSTYLCMGVLDKHFVCRSCKKDYLKRRCRGKVMKKLLVRMRIIEDANMLRICKKARGLEFSVQNHGILRGDCVSNLSESFCLSPLSQQGNAVTSLPEGYQLCMNRDCARVYPVSGVFYLTSQGTLELSKEHREGSPSTGLPAFPTTWELPPGHYVLVERIFYPKGDEHMNEVVSSKPVRKEDWETILQRLRIIQEASSHPAQEKVSENPEEEKGMSGADEGAASRDEEGDVAEIAKGGEGAGEIEEGELDEDDFFIRLDTHRDPPLRRQAQVFRYLEEFQRKEDPPETQYLQYDQPLTDLDFVVELVGGQPFRSPPSLEQYGSAKPTRCSTCAMPSFWNLKKNASEEEACLMARRDFSGEYTNQCPQCIEKTKLEQSSQTQSLKDFLRADERDAVVVLRLRDKDKKNQMRIYRVLWWLTTPSFDIRVLRMFTFKSPADSKVRSYFVLNGYPDLVKLENALQADLNGSAKSMIKSVCVPHYKDPLDEALSTQSGVRTYMQTLQTQPFASAADKKSLQMMLKERNPMVVTNKKERALVAFSNPSCQERSAVSDSEGGESSESSSSLSESDSSGASGEDVCLEQRRPDLRRRCSV